MKTKAESTKTQPSKLKYIPDTMEGYTRQPKGKGFAYFFNGSLVKKTDLIMRFNSLVIPPAWKSVWISPAENGHLQATGIDIKGRKQYIYHPEWQQMQHENKFARIAEFGKALPCIRKNIRKDIRKRRYTKEKIVAIALQLMEETLIRAGNSYYRDQNNSYGLTTLKNKHVQIQGSAIFFNFRGKKGVLHKIKVSDRSLAKQLKNVKEIPGQSLFQYVDKDGSISVLDSGDLNKYIQQCTKQDFTSKDFRTWYGTVWAFRKLCELGSFENQTQFKRNILEMYDFVASKLGNTRSVCKKYYVSDRLIKAYEEQTIVPFIKKALRKGGSLSEMEKAEKQLLQLLNITKNTR
jgi:DNA topoisomerase-1